MLVSDKLAIAAHMHVLLRRKTGRVTDTEWMATNLDYRREIVRFARVKAVEDGHPDLAEWADKLERTLTSETPPARVPLAQSAMRMLRERSAAAPVTGEAADASGFAQSASPDTGFGDSTLGDPSRPRRSRDPDVPRYVGGIR